MTLFHRLVSLPDLTKQSVFLWGPRKVGKSSWIREHLSDVIYIDLLKRDVFGEYSANPSLLRQRYALGDDAGSSQPIVIDEVQKCPDLLDEIHWMIENTPRRFLLTGSSVRKLRRSHANLLGGRAWRREMRPLTSAEINGSGRTVFDIERAVIQGLIPSHYLSTDYREELRGYVNDYLVDEIANEGAVRNLALFSNFLRVASLTNAELLNYSNIAREVGVSPKVVRGYFEILEDTQIGFRIPPWSRSKTRRLVETEKFYLFDVGVANFLARRAPQFGTSEFGKSFEHFVLMELLAYRSYRAPDTEIHFWRTSTGQEVDFIINDREVAIEIKASKRTDPADCRQLHTLAKDGGLGKRILVSFEEERKHFSDSAGIVEVLPWRTFLELLWSGELF